jgi:hypothetical protein
VDAETFKSIQILALKAVEMPDYEAFYRRVSRWYSNKFNTSLHIVETLSENHVLQAYFEDQYGELYNSKDDNSQNIYQEIRQELLTNGQQLENDAKKDDEWEREMLAAIQKDSNIGATGPNNQAVTEDPNLIEERFVTGESDIPSQDNPDE